MSDTNETAGVEPSHDPRRQRLNTLHLHRIYNPADLARAIEELSGGVGEGNFDDGHWSDPATVLATLSNEDTNRLRQLKRIAADPKGFKRRSTIGSRGMVSRIEALSTQMPHFAPAIDLVARAALVSARTATPLRLPPILMPGEAGIGKSFTISRLAEVVGGDFRLIAANLLDSFRIRGLNTAWRGARMGCIAEMLLGSTTAPIALVDEFDKAPGRDRIDRPYDVWHSLLERENSAHFRDDFLEIEFKADQIIWFASANNVTAFPSSILDRLLVIEIPPPNRDQLRSIIAGLYANCREAYGGMIPERLNDDVIHELARHNPRRIGRILDLAVGFSAAKGRRHLSADDVQRANQLAGESLVNQRGFKGPVGFTRSRRPH